MVCPPAISTTMASKTCNSANRQGSRIASTTIAATAHSRTLQKKPVWACSTPRLARSSPILKTKACRIFLSFAAPVLCSFSMTAADNSPSNAMPSNSRALRKALSRTPRSPTTTMMGGSTFIFACTATMSALSSITTRPLTSMHATARQIFLLRNEGNAIFRDCTEAAGLNVENDRYSFACAWGDYNADGHPDLYVANDFGRSNLYRNNGDGSFTAVSTEAGIDDPGAGMSASWFDYDSDGKQDVYISNMWSAAGIRVSEQEPFHQGEAENIRALYRRHARGNSLYRNLGEGKFQNLSEKAGVEMGRWAWSSDAWDFDHDGYPDLYIANGYISGPESSGSELKDVSSFFWRQVVGKSPQNFIPSAKYENGWNAINELIRSDATWNGYERNVFCANNRDGTFSDVSGVTGLDFPDDSRAFALADLDHDGRLEIVLKNRNAPQLRILRNVVKELGNAVAFRLRGTK